MEKVSLSMSSHAHTFDPTTITRPNPRLMTYYVIVSVCSLVAFPVTLLTLFVRFRTMRFRFDDEGVWRSQGLLWKREVNVAYRRIQDIQLTNGIIQRWLGLSTVSIQTAAGSATPEVTIEGVLEAEALRDYLYTKMRGVRDGGQGRRPANGTTDTADDDAADREVLALLADIRDSLRRVEARLEEREQGPGV
jgi:putative membrane protein